MTHDQGALANTAANGVRSTIVSSAESRLIVDVTDKISLLEPAIHPLTTLLTNVGKNYDGQTWKGSGLLKREVTNPEFGWFEDYYGGRYAKVSGAVTTGAVTITVTGAGTQSAYIFTVGDLVKNARTGEVFLVATIAGATTITAASTGRGFGSTADTAMADGDGLYIIGNVNEENAGARNVNTTRSAKQTNYTQIFKTSIAVSGTEKEAGLYGGPDLPYQRAKKGTEHMRDIERAFLFGQKKYDTNGTQSFPRRATGGVLEFIESGSGYIQNQGGVLTAPDFNTFLREGFTYGSNNKVLMCGGLILQAINEMARGQIQMRPNETSYGMKISEWVTPFGTINIVANPMLVNDYAGYGFLLDLDCFKYAYMRNRDTKLQTNIQANDTDGEIDQYISEVGLERTQAAKCALLKGVTA